MLCSALGCSLLNLLLVPPDASAPTYDMYIPGMYISTLYREKHRCFGLSLCTYLLIVSQNWYHTIEGIISDLWYIYLV